VTVLLLFLIPLAVGLPVMLVLKRRRLLIGGIGAILLVLGVVITAYSIATHGPLGSSCSDCQQFAGRYWEPDLAVFLGLIAAAGWGVGSVLGIAMDGFLHLRSEPRSGLWS
jgi:drug/metabolite transporter (DMT)-like permease